MNTPRNNPRINPDDPKWTAYVLGELDAAESAEIERLLETSDEARALVEELCVATDALKDELLPHASAVMLPEQRAAIRTAADQGVRRWFEVFPSRWAWGLGLAAASLIALVAVRPMLVNRGEGTRSVMEDVAAVEKAAEKAASFSDSRAEREQAAAPTEALQASVPAASARSAETIGTAPAKLIDQSAQLNSQPPSAALIGRVQDPSGALMPGVTVRAVNPETGVVSTAITSETGSYSLPSLQPGKAYAVSAALPGFQTKTEAAVDLTSSSQVRQDFKMEIASVLSSVEVKVAADGLLTASSASVGEVRSENRVRELPLVGNNVLDLITVLPGTNAVVTQQAQVTTVRDGLSVDPNSSLSSSILTNEALLNLPKTEAELAAYLSQLAAQRGAGEANANIAIDGFRAAAAPPPPAPAPPPASVARGGGGGGGRGGGAPAAGAAARGQQGQQGQQGGQAQSGQRVFSQGQQGQQGQQGGGVVIVNNSFSAAPPPPPPPAAPMPLAVTANLADRDQIARPQIGTEAYDRIVDNPFIRASQQNFATLSIDVDTASYSNVRRFLTQNQLPPKDAVRIEELINYFSYDYAQPTGQNPIAPNMEVASAPWNPQHRLVRVGIKARDINVNRRPPSNLVFLIDVSGSMNEANKLPLVKSGLKLLVNNLAENDFVSMVVYAGASGLVLSPTSGARKDTINQAIDNLSAGGSTNGGAGIQLAYNQAVSNFIRNGVNRVILMTDGDFNVGITNQGDLTRLIEERAKSGVFLSVLGFGTGNLNDSTMQKLADMGNGHYVYIDTINEARKVLVDEMGGTLVTVAKDVKIQVDFNPDRVEAYRLIGYENRVLRTEDFNNDLKDAGDMGAGHTVTALFEVVPKGLSVPGPSIDPSRYATTPPQPTAAAGARPAAGSNSNELLNLRVRYKLPDASDSTRMDVPLTDRGTQFSNASQDFRFAASVASFGMILRDSPYRGNATMNTVLDMATASRGQDRNGYRNEFISLVRKANSLRNLTQ